MSRSGLHILAAVGCLHLRIVSATVSDFVRFETDPGDSVKPKQPLLLADRGGRFLRFDTKDTEIELELGVAVPFLKIPLAASAGAEPSDHRVSVNPAGLLVGATILFTSFLLIPWVLPTSPGGHHTRRVEGDEANHLNDVTYGDGGRTDGGGAWGIVQEMEQFLTSQHLDPRSCPLKALCMVGQHINSAMPPLFDAMLRFEAVKKVADSTEMTNAIRSGDCDTAYPTCMLTRQTMALVPRMLGFKGISI